MPLTALYSIYEFTTLTIPRDVLLNLWFGFGEFTMCDR